MYGMIHQALRGMIREHHGAAAWDEIERIAGSGPAHMVSASVYPDEVTNGLIGSAAQHVGLDVDTFLQEFGVYWITFVESGAYGHILKFMGRDLAEFIGNLDRMHQSLQSSMPQARMPSFRLVEQTGRELLIDYTSTRSGLEHLAIGLFYGLLARFGLSGKVTATPDGTGPVRLHVILDEAEAA